MTIKFTYGSSPVTQLSIADRAELTLDGDFAIGHELCCNGIDTGTYQVNFRTGASGESGAIIGLLASASDTGKPNCLYFQIGSSTTRCQVGPIEYGAGKNYIVVLQRTGGVFTAKLCPVLSTAPTDGAAVMSSLTYSYAAGFDGTAGLIIGAHSLANRRTDQSIGRFFIAPRALTDFEIAQLAHGHEITKFVTPRVYRKMTGPTDYADTGSLANTVTAQGALTQGAAPGYGYDSTPTAPIITGKPIIQGSPTPGVASSYTQAAATGNPSPTITQQWTIDGVDIAGATGGTYTPSAGDDGKSLRVRQTATNGVGSPATSTSDPALVTSGEVGLDMAELIAERIYQRVNGAATVALSGTYVGAAPASIEYQLYAPDGTTVVKTWTAMTATISGGTWSASPSIPAPTDGNKYRIAVRSKNASGTPLYTTPAKTNRFGVGDVIMVIGSSSPAAWFTDGSGTGNAVDQNLTSQMSSNALWSVFGTDGRAGQMSEYIAQRLGVPVAMCSLGLGGSSLTDWAPAEGTRWGSFRSAVAAAGGKIAGVFASVGSNDVTNASKSLTVEAHLALMNAVRDNARADTGQANLPILWSGINRRTSALELQANNARTAENLFGDQPNCYHVQALDFELSGDGTHLTGAGYAACCIRMRYVWAEAILGNYYRGPKITQLVHSGDKVSATLAHRGGTDFTPTTDITGFVVTDDSGAATVTSAVRQDATHILLTCNRTLVNPKVTYLAGPAPEVGTPIYSNATVALPMTAEAFIVTTAGAIEQPLTLVPYYREYTLSRAILPAAAQPDNTSRTVSVSLGDANGVAANLTGMMVSLRTGTGPHNSGAALYQSATETTDANGVLSFSFESSGINVGGTALLDVLLQDGRNLVRTVTVT